MDKELTRQERIEDLSVAVERHRANVLEAEKQLQGLMVSEGLSDATRRQELAQILDDDKVGPKGLLDRIFKVPLRKKEQLTHNVDNLKFVIDKERRAADKAAHEKKRLENEIKQERIDGVTVDVFEKYRKWTELYQVAEDFFYKDLLCSIRDAYETDPRFHMRAERLKLSPAIMVSIDSHFAHDSLRNVNMFNVIERMTDLGMTYGEHFFKKVYERQMDLPLVREFTT
jgi:hypothetical protein